MKKYIVFASIGFELVGLIVASWALGSYLDEKYHSKGLIFIGLSLLCLVGWLVRVIWLLKRMQKLEEKESNSDGNGSL